MILARYVFTILRLESLLALLLIMLALINIAKKIKVLSLLTLKKVSLASKKEIIIFKVIMEDIYLIQPSKILMLWAFLH